MRKEECALNPVVRVGNAFVETIHGGVEVTIMEPERRTCASQKFDIDELLRAVDWAKLAEMFENAAAASHSEANSNRNRTLANYAAAIHEMLGPEREGTPAMEVLKQA